jgi:hypothetical protein
MRLSTGFVWRRTLVSVTAASALSCAFWLQRISLLRWVAFTMARLSLRLRYPSTPARRVSGVRLPDTAVSPRFSPLRTSRWAGGDAFTPASGGQDLHLHKDRVTRRFALRLARRFSPPFSQRVARDTLPQNVSAPGGLSSTGAVWYILPIQELAILHYCAAPCREPFLIGNLPRAYFLAPLRVLLPNAACM